MSVMNRFKPRFLAEDVGEDECVMAEVGKNPDKYASVLCEVEYDEKLDKHGNKIKVYRGFTRKPNVQNGGVMLYFPMGHSLHVESEEQAEKTFRLNLANPRVDMETGEDVPDDFEDEMDYKRLVERNTTHRRRQPRTAAAVEED